MAAVEACAAPAEGRHLGGACHCGRWPADRRREIRASSGRGRSTGSIWLTRRRGASKTIRSRQGGPDLDVALAIARLGRDASRATSADDVRAARRGCGEVAVRVGWNARPAAGARRLACRSRATAGNGSSARRGTRSRCARQRLQAGRTARPTPSWRWATWCWATPCSRSSMPFTSAIPKARHCSAPTSPCVTTSGLAAATATDGARGVGTAAPGLPARRPLARGRIAGRARRRPRASGPAPPHDGRARRAAEAAVDRARSICRERGVCSMPGGSATAIATRSSRPSPGGGTGSMRRQMPPSSRNWRLSWAWTDGGVVPLGGCSKTNPLR